MPFHLATRRDKSARIWHVLYFALVDIDSQEKIVTKQEIVSNPYRDIEKGRGIKVAELLLTYKPDVIVARESLSGKGPGYVFADSGTEIRQTGAKSMNEFEDQLLSGNSESEYKQ